MYFYELGLKVGIDKIALMMKKLGLGQYYNIEINNKSKGVVPNIEWKLKRDGLKWSMGETLNASWSRLFTYNSFTVNYNDCKNSQW